MYDLDDPQLQQSFVQRYIHNQLLPDEIIVFEEYLMEHPELLEAIELDKLMSHGLGNVSPVSAQSDTKHKSRWFYWLLTGACATYLIVFLAGTSPSQSTKLEGIDRLVYIDAIRSADSVQKRILLKASSQKMMLLLSTGLGQTGPFDVKVTRIKSGETVAEIHNVKQTETNDIVLLLNTELFTTGFYQLTTKDIPSQVQTSAIIELVENKGE